MKSARSNSDRDFSLGMGLSILERGLHADRPEEVMEGAGMLETILEEGLVSLKWESVVTLLAGLGYDSVGENNRARRLYLRLQRVSSPLPVSAILYGSLQVAKLFTESVANYGLRRLRELGSSLEVVIDFCKRGTDGSQQIESPDDRLVLFLFEFGLDPVLIFSMTPIDVSWWAGILS